MTLPLLPPDSSRFQIATNTASQLVGRIVSSGALFIASILIARAFGANGYGDFVKITSFIALFYLLADFGMNAIYLQQTEDRENLWATLLGLRVVGSIFLVFLALAILAFLPQGTSQGYTSGVRLGIILFSPAIILQALITSANALFQKKLRYDRSMIAVMVGAIVTVGGVWIVALSTSSLVGPVASALAVLAGTATTMLVSFVFIRTYVSLKIALDTQIAKQMLVASIPLGLTLLFNQIYFRADSIILTLTRATGEVGIYGFAYKIFEVALVIPTFFMNSVYPLMLSNTQGELQRMIKKSFLFLILSSFLAVVFLWMAAPLVGLVRGEFVQSIGALRILSLSLPFFFVSSLAMWTIITLKRQNMLVPIYGVSMLVNIVLNSWLIPIYGYMAASWITLVSEALVLLATGAVALNVLYAKRNE